MYSNNDLEQAVEHLLSRQATSPLRLQLLADLLVTMLAAEGLLGAKGGKSGELAISGLARTKNWDVAFEFAGKFRLAVSLKSMLENIAGTVPNRLDDLMGELANVQQLAPEIVIGYVILFDVSKDKRRKDGVLWSDYFEQRLSAISIRKAPMWNQGLLEGHWFIRFDSTAAAGHRVVDPARTVRAGRAFAEALVAELSRREPAVKLAAKQPPLLSP
jgi:hypothetical protein